MFSESDIRFFGTLGATASDAVRALRPGGPLDRTWFTTVCLRCGVTKRATIRWFHGCDFRCGCGGEFNASDLSRWIVAMRDGNFAAAGAISSIEFVPYDPDSDSQDTA